VNNIKLAWKNIIHKPLNLLLSILLFALGIGLINFLLLLNTQVKEKFEANLADIDLVVGAKGSPLQMILCNMYHIDNPTGNISVEDASVFFNPRHPVVKKAIPLSLGDTYRNYRIVGTNYDLLDLYKASLGEGALWKKDFEVTIGKQVADVTGLKIGDTFLSSHGLQADDDLTHEHGELRVVGILNPTGSVIDQLILTNTSSVWRVHEEHDHESEDHEGHDHAAEGHEGHDHAEQDSTATMAATEEPDYNSNQFLLSNPEQEITALLVQYKVKNNIMALNLPRLINENTKLQAASPAIEINKLYSMMGVGTNALQSIALLIAFVSAISIFITLFRSMRERRYELAIMRVLGGSRTKIFGLVIMEGLILTLIGFVIGNILSHVGMEVMAKYLHEDFRYSFTGGKFILDEAYLLVASLIIGFIAAFIPALQAAKTDIHKTLSKQ